VTKFRVILRVILKFLFCEKKRNFYLQDKEVFLEENDQLVFIDEDKNRVFARMVS